MKLRFPSKVRPLFLLAALGVLIGIYAAVYSGKKNPPEPPVFKPASNPYPQGIYANGIVESFQSSGENINIYPEVGGTVTKILAREGQRIRRGEPILQLDDEVEKATAAQLRSQAEAAHSLLEELKAQPRKETLAVAEAQVGAAKASLKNVRDQLAKLLASYRLNRRSVSRNDLDNARNAVNTAQKQLEVTTRQYELTRAGAWIYDIRNQERQYEALQKQADAASAVLAKYTIRAPADGTIFSIHTAVGSYISPQGVYATYTQGLSPVVVMGEGSDASLQVRTYVDEILVPKLPEPGKITGQMFVRGSDKAIPLEFVRMQPYITPKIELSNQRLERVDVRVLPLIFRFEKPPGVNLFPGQLVDVYLGQGAPRLAGKLPPEGSRRSTEDAKR